MFDITITLNDAELQAWIAALPAAVQRTCIRVAQEAQLQASYTAPVRSGGLQQSHYVISADGSVNDYEERVGVYQQFYEAEYGSAGRALPAATPPPEGAVMGCAAEYGFYQEHGTRYHPPQPWFEAATDYARRQQGRLWQEEVSSARPYLGTGPTGRQAGRR